MQVNDVCPIGTTQLLYSAKIKRAAWKNKYIQFDKKIVTETIGNKRNLLYILCTEFNHIICLFTPNAPQLPHHSVRMPPDDKLYVYLLRSQFGSSSLECPCEILPTHSTNTYWPINEGHRWNGILFGAFSVFESRCMLRSKYLKTKGNELCGGKEFNHSSIPVYFKITRIEIHQIK
eukprot:102730_1